MPKKKKFRARVLKSYNHQTGMFNDIFMDRQIKAKKPGKRISSSGKIYYESRKNRSDLKNNI